MVTHLPAKLGTDWHCGSVEWCLFDVILQDHVIRESRDFKPPTCRV